MRILTTLAILLLTACAGAPTRPVPVEPRSAPTVVTPTPSGPAATPGPGSQDAQVIAPAPPRQATSDATETLVLASATASAAGDHKVAIAHLERAIRLDGRNADLWARLSTAYLHDGRTALARQYANRALALSGNRGDWKRSAWLAIAALEEHEGNYAEAQRLRALYPSERG